MNKQQFNYIQSKIGYFFKNEALLDQAFTRKSYAEEHPEVQHNEVLEFFGDKILDLYITKLMYKKFSKVVDGHFVSTKNEGELTKLKASIVSKNSLANCIWTLGFSKFLYLGNSDKKNEVWKSESVNEDLFEAILGAVAVDSDWNIENLENVCRTMLQNETINNYLISEVQDKSIALGFGQPELHPMNFQTNNPMDFNQNNIWAMMIGARDFATTINPKTSLHEYGIAIGKNNFLGRGESLIQAFLNAHIMAYQFLCQEEIKRNFSNLDCNNSVSALHELFQKGVIKEPFYEFAEDHDKSGNPIWSCKVMLEGFGKFEADDASKKKVKQDAASKLLHYMLDTVVERVNEFEVPVFFSGGALSWSEEEKTEQTKLINLKLKKKEEK